MEIGEAMTAARKETGGEPPALEVKDLECRYGADVVLTDINFFVKPGQLFFVVGRSGCGKSTLLRHLIGLRKPARGSIAYFGRPFSEPDGVSRKALLKTFGVLYQNNALWSSMTIGENLALPLEEYTDLTRQERSELVAIKLGQVGLAGSEKRYPAELSGGMKKRAALARALMLDPAIVFFDEPSAGLDPVTSRELDELILRIRGGLGTTMVIVSHELSSIFSLADRVLLLERGIKGILAEGPLQELTGSGADPRVRAFFRPDEGRESGAERSDRQKVTR